MVQIAPERPHCGGCGFEINDYYLLKVALDYWHENCLICFCCGISLSHALSCFIRDNRVYCHTDYKTIYSVKCARCGVGLKPTDLVYPGPNNTYHANCFACIHCGRMLQQGDLYVLFEGHLLCKLDYELLMCNSESHRDFYELNCHSSQKAAKRARTILNSTQRRAFKASFDNSTKPCRKVREALAKDTGLTVRVVQVWFQNQRAKMKKCQLKHELHQLQRRKKYDKTRELS